jgi:hypothetical protein
MTQDEILEAIRSAVEGAEEAGNEPGTIVRSEIQQAFGVGESKARDIARMLVTEGVLEPIRHVKRKDMWGYWRPVVGFRYVNGQGE